MSNCLFSTIYFSYYYFICLHERLVFMQHSLVFTGVIAVTPDPSGVINSH